MTEVTLIHPYDPFSVQLGGIGSFITSFIKYAPQDFRVRLVGISDARHVHPVPREALPVKGGRNVAGCQPEGFFPDAMAVKPWYGVHRSGVWNKEKLGERDFLFFPCLTTVANARRFIPLSLSFTQAVKRYLKSLDLGNSILEFHRIEAALLFKKFKNKKVLFLHGNMRDLYNPATEVKWGKFPRLYFFLEKKIIPLMERVYIVREDAIEDYRDRYRNYKDRFFFLPSWVDTRIFYPLPLGDLEQKRLDFMRKNNLPREAKLVLFVGRFEGQKDPLLCLEAFSLLKKRIPAAKLILVGEGKLKPQMLKFIQEHSLDNDVVLTGAVPRKDLAELMNICDCLLMTSAFEGMPRVALEALACGLAVVTTEAGEVRRIIKNEICGKIAGERLSPAVAEALEFVLRRRGKDERITRSQSVSQFGAKRVLANVYQYYRELA